MNKLRRKIRDLIWLIISKFHKNVMVCYGTSLTEGTGWVKLLAKELPEWHVVNLAKGGMNSNWGIDNIKTVLRFKPKIVLMEWAINDSYVDCPYYKPTSLLDSFRNVSKMIKLLGKKDIILLGMNPPLNMFLSGRNPARVRPKYREYAEMHKKIAKDKSLRYIDITSVWDSLSTDDFLYYCPDGIHPNIRAAKDLIVPKILEVLK